MTQHEQEVLSSETEDYYIKATNLSKTYDTTKLQAVVGNTFGVKKGNILGLLGPNGAGKSTTFSMMAMDFHRTSGEASILNQTLDNINIDEHGRYIGLCPQYNSIWERLTVDESLLFFARLRGLSAHDTQENMALVKDTLELNEFSDT